MERMARTESTQRTPTRARTLVALLAALASLPGCREAQGVAATGPEPVAVEVRAVATGAVEDAIAVSGTLEAATAADVRAEVPGVVAEVFVRDWVPVTRGTRLARLDARELDVAVATARAELRRAEAAHAAAKRELSRWKRLADTGAVATQALDEARTGEELAGAAVRAARAQAEAAALRREKADVRAPMDGVVASRTVDVGDLVGAEPLFRIVDPHRLRLRVGVPARRSASVRPGQTVAFTVESRADVEWRGTVAFVNPAADATAGTVDVLVDVETGDTDAPPDGTLKPGLFARGRLLVATRPDVALVPRDGLVRYDATAGTAEVFRVVDGRAKRQPVRTGARALDGQGGGDRIEVRDGLAVGDEVVTRGAFLLRDGLPVLVTGTM